MSMRHPVVGRLGTLRFRLVAPTVSAGELVTLAQVPPIVVEDTLMLVRASVKFTLPSALPLGLVRTKLMVVVPFTGIAPGLNPFSMDGGDSTVKFAKLDVAPAVGVCVVVTPLEVLGWAPYTLLVTCTVTVQLVLAASVGAFKSSAVAPTVKAGELVVPVQVPPIVVDATVISTSVSVKRALLSAVGLGLVSVKLNVLICPVPMLLGLKAFAIVGELTTIRLAVLETAPAVPDCVVATPLVVLG